MKPVLLTIFLFAHTAFCNSIQERVKLISSLIKERPDEAIQLAIHLKADATAAEDEYGMVQSNFMIGYAYRIKEDYGNAIIYYLDAIRQAERSNYPGVIKNLISLHKNCGVIYRKFKAYDLALNSYHNGLEYAKQANDIDQITSLSYNISWVYLYNESYQIGIETTTDLLSEIEFQSEGYYKILSTLSLMYQKAGDYENAKKNALEITKSPFNKYIGYANHILGRIYALEKNTSKAESYYIQSLVVARANPDEYRDKKAEFEVLYELGQLAYSQGNYADANLLYSEAENLINQVSQLPEHFELYKSRANLHYELNEIKKMKHYEDLYSSSYKSYFDLKQKIEAEDKNHNMQLITERYFSEIEKQKQAASLELYQYLIGITLTFFLLFIRLKWHQRQKLGRLLKQDFIDAGILRYKDGMAPKDQFSWLAFGRWLIGY